VYFSLTQQDLRDFANTSNNSEDPFLRDIMEMKLIEPGVLWNEHSRIKPIWSAASSILGGNGFLDGFRSFLGVCWYHLSPRALRRNLMFSKNSWVRIIEKSRVCCLSARCGCGLFSTR
jgi:hypothetical protein